MGHPEACKADVETLTDGSESRSIDPISPQYPSHADHSTSLSDSKQSPGYSTQTEIPKPRRFLAQPIETVSRSSKNQQPVSTGIEPHTATSPVEPPLQGHNEHRPRRFAPEPIETTKSSNRRSHTASEVTGEFLSQPKTTTPRRFKPELIETDTRSVRTTDTSQILRRHNTSGPLAHASTSPGTTAWSNADHHAVSLSPPESRFSYSSLLHRQEGRRHSFRVPALPSIPSNSSEESDNSRSHSACTSPLGPSNKTTKGIKSSKVSRESCSEEFSEFLLSLAARSAQKQLREQALAAFPNEQVYEPVDHFAIDEDDRDLEEDGPSTHIKYRHIKSRRQSSADLSWELEYMRHHKEEAEMRLRAMMASGQQESSRKQKNNGPSPPMLGSDIVLPQSLSPEGTICEHPHINTAVTGGQDLCNDCEGLWCAGPHRQSAKGAGLWMGTCCKDEKQEQEGPGLFPGIVTPMAWIDETGVGVGLSPSPSHIHLDRLATSPGNSGRKATSPNLRKALDAEFHDGFVTQIFNYLSLGYPCLARYYDYELSRISGITVEELRQDDLHTDARGYFALDNKDLTRKCTRWNALRLYIQEWVRQEPGMVEDETNLEGWGLPERKGSWAI
ncbi:uncharacterized protein N7511_005257 [Penicillium nucicola]|uniref:uncharacterized protein n=1 Tax=Penicillium nucicola TaxID=1850975 RepID=UPI00254545D6|nr:uncharacterized protein N7511_005257 [Penicillium nucicola]KAJ5761875.1 hypothetical protein N7511_005257 [Penicillium nucicola]